MTYGFKNGISNLVNFHTRQLKVMLDKSSEYNVLAEGMYFLDKSPSNFNFLDFHCLSEVAQLSHVIFETRNQLLHKLCIIL